MLLHDAISFRLNAMCKAISAIKALGGPSQVAREFGFSVQRVSNWSKRGIPADVILDNPTFAQQLFAAGYVRKPADEQAAA